MSPFSSTTNSICCCRWDAEQRHCISNSKKKCVGVKEQPSHLLQDFLAKTQAASTPIVDGFRDFMVALGFLMDLEISCIPISYLNLSLARAGHHVWSLHALFLFFLLPYVFPILFHPCFVSVFRLMWVSSLAYPNLLRTKRFGCCCCSGLSYYQFQFFFLVIFAFPFCFRCSYIFHCF
jgi:hypothetical protein